MKSVGLIAHVVAVAVALACVDAKCPELKSVQVDDAWFKKAEPEGGWHILLEKGGSMTKKEEYEEVPDSQIAGADAKFCYTPKISVQGADLGSGPSYTCYHVAGSVGEQHCEIDEGTGGSAVEAAKAAGIHVPKTFKAAAVDTDNQSYVAFGGCGDGGLYSWTVMATTKDAKFDKKKVLEALGITEQDDKDAESNEIKYGRVVIEDGECKPPAPAAA